MDVFISWSGERSRAVAELLKDWIPDVLQNVNTWMSPDIEAGARWSREIDERLSITDFGVTCLNRENLRAPWILFEAGALAKNVGEARMVPYLMDDLGPADLESPLGLFQGQRWDKQGTWQLVRSLNRNLEKALESGRLERIFEALWSRFEARLQEVPEPDESVQAKPRDPNDVLVEILETVRSMSSTLDRSYALERRQDRALTSEIPERIEREIFEIRSRMAPDLYRMQASAERAQLDQLDKERSRRHSDQEASGDEIDTSREEEIEE